MSFDVTQQRPDRHAPICTEEARDRQPQLASAGLATKGGLRPGQGAAERSVRMLPTYQENWFQVWPLGPASCCHGSGVSPGEKAGFSSSILTKILSSALTSVAPPGS